MDTDGRPNKRARMTPEAHTPSTTAFDTNADFIAFDKDEHDAPPNAPTEPREAHTHRVDPRNRFDRPKSKHPLPGYEPWVLVKTKLGRRFVHNTNTQQSLWRIPQSVRAGVAAYDDQQEKQKNAAWAEQQLTEMRRSQAARRSEAANPENAAVDERGRRRRSESLQREDEEAMMAELAAESINGDDEDTNTKAAIDDGPRGYLGAASDSEYEYIEVTDSEGEHDDDDGEEDVHGDPALNGDAENQHEDTATQDQADAGPAELGEDDIAYQLAMMGESYGLDAEEYGLPDEDQDMEDAETALIPTAEEATAIFHQMLDDHGVSPFTPWDKIIADTTSTSVVFDDRYTLLPSSKARKDAWDGWSRDRAAQVQRERALHEKTDPRIAFLAFLAKHASSKLYWPEFKRKFKREPQLNDRALQDKDREKLYRELVAKLKLSESRREEELRAVLKALPTPDSTASVPQKALTHPAYYSVSAAARQRIVEAAGYHYSQIV